MPKRPLRPCSYPGCAALVERGRCSAHQVTERPYHDADVQRLYKTARWQRLRRLQLSSSPWCAECLASGIYIQATDVDHIEPHHGDEIKFFTGRLQSMCHSCHSRKTASEVFNHPGGVKKFSPGGLGAGGAIRTKKNPNVGNPPKLRGPDASQEA